MRYLLDTNTAHAYVHGNAGIKERADQANRQGHRVGLSVTVLAELISGIEYSQSRDRNVLLLKKAMRTLYLWPFDEQAAYQYGSTHAQLKRQGTIIGSNDIMIAATALTLQPCSLVSTDSDFQHVAGLTVVNWMRE